MTEKKQVLILFGGASPEYSVSLRSASGVIAALDLRRYTPVLVGITQQGEWLHFAGDVAQITPDEWHTTPHCTKATLALDGSQTLLVFEQSGIRRIAVDVVFPVLHGQNGEDGSVQGLCQLAGVPVAGCDVLASALCMDKHRAHQLVQIAGIAVPNGVVLRPDYTAFEAAHCAAALGYPLFIKPVKAGSSYGISRITQESELLPALQNAFCFDTSVLLEQAIEGFEVGCAVMGNDDLICGGPDEIELTDGFFDFAEKYNLITSKIHLPARIDAATAAKVKTTARQIYRTLGCRGFARVDMFLTPQGCLVFNEVNTLPGFTAHSRFPAMMGTLGMSFAAVVTHAIELALMAERTTEQEPTP